MLTFSRIPQERLPQALALYRSAGAAEVDLTELERAAAAGVLYGAQEDGGLAACFVLSPEPEPAYARVDWLYGVRPAVWQRVAARTPAEKSEALLSAAALTRDLGFDTLRLDVPEADDDVRSACERAGARQAGSLELEGGERCLCYEMPLSPACPMLPVRMRPAYRYGDMTPWGGVGLRERFGRDIPDERTGEALEISAIPGLESVTPMGETLTGLLKRDKERILGRGQEPFALLLKLLSARENLSVQVHPDDAYASVHENKLGKTEAWVILDAKPGASILYGLRQGVSLADLEAALKGGADVEALIERVPVSAGEVYYMPSGMVHAIGGGIVLYEIQQSSDVTYRLWDYDRLNDRGEKRPLHIRQSLDVIRPQLRGQRARMPQELDNRVTNLLDVPAFRLDCAAVNGELALPEHPQGFRILTALSGLLLRWPGDAMELAAGDSVLLPAACPDVTLTGVGCALLAMEAL